MSNAIWLSIGENCLTSDLLRRFGLFAPSTIYSHARCNINHVVQIETGGFKQLLNRSYLVHGKTYGDVDCVFSTIIKDRDLPFEFTHINPVNIWNRKLLESRIKRMLKARDSEDRKIFCYHYRSSDGFKDSFKQEMLCAIEILSGLFLNSCFFVFTQKVVMDSAERGFLMDASENYAFAELKSVKKWQGSEDLYGRFDDDIFKDVITKVKQRLLQ